MSPSGASTASPTTPSASGWASTNGSTSASARALRVCFVEIGGASMDPEVRAGLARSWKGLMTVGVLAIGGGRVAILVPALPAVGTAIFIGWILVIAGAFLVAAAFSAHSVGSLVMRLIWALLTGIVRLWLIGEH